MSSPLSDKLLARARVLLKIERLEGWAEFIGGENGHQPSKHHRLLLSVLEMASNTPRQKIILVLPTGSAKSTYASTYFPPWYLKKHPKHGILACSHSAHLAKNFGRKCRDTVDKYELELGMSISDRSQAADEWETTTGAYYFAAGVGTKIAGRRADLGLIDDPFGSREEADSQQHRDNVWEWYEWDFKRRLQPNASQVIISTRWHQDDLVGRLLSKEGDEWTLVHVPFTVENAAQEARDPLGRKIGERIWPEYFTAAMEKDLRKNLRAWQALQQGEPAPDEGLMFTEGMLRTYSKYEDLPTGMQNYCSSDHAVKTKEQNDLNAFIPAGVDSEGNIWIYPDVFWKRANTKEQVEQMIAMAIRRSPNHWFAGADHITGAIGPFLNDRKLEAGVFFSVVELPDYKDKVKKAQSFHGLCEMGKVFFPSFAQWWPQAKYQLLSFPAGANDDFLDSLANLGRGLAYLQRGIRTPDSPKEQKPFHLSDMTGKWLKNQRSNKTPTPNGL